MGSQTGCHYHDLCTVVLGWSLPVTLREEQNIDNPNTNVCSSENGMNAVTYHLERFEHRNLAGF